jgi:hypothetical protein
MTATSQIYIDKDLKKPDGSPVTIKDLHPDSDFGYPKEYKCTLFPMLTLES